jgi:hypothetical protein
LAKGGSPLTTPADFFSEHQPSGLLAITKTELKNTQKEMADLKRRLLDSGPKVQLIYRLVDQAKTLIIKPDRSIANFKIDRIESPRYSLRLKPEVLQVPIEGVPLQFRHTAKMPRADGSKDHNAYHGFEDVFDDLCADGVTDIRLKVSFWERRNEYREEWSIEWVAVLSGLPNWQPEVRPVPGTYAWIDHYAARDTTDDKATTS